MGYLDNCTIGGWKGYTSQRKRSPIVLQKGLAKFYNVYEGGTLYQNYHQQAHTHTVAFGEGWGEA